LLREREISLTDIADFLGKTVSFVSRVNKGQRRSLVVEREIARWLMLSEDETFPERAKRRISRRTRRDGLL